MALVIKDRVKELTTTAGTGAVTLLGSLTGYQTFTSAVGNGNTTYYAIVDNTSGDWEVGLGTYTSATTSLSRDTVLSSSNAGSLVTFSSSSKDVFVTYPASKGIYTDSAGNTIALGTPASATLTNATGLPLTTGVTGTLPITNGGTGTTSTTFTNLTTNVTGTLPVANGGTGITSLGTGVATFLGAPTSANLASAVTDETGSGSLVFATSPTLVTPVLGTPSSGDLTSCTGYTYANLSGTVPTWNQNTTGTAAGLSSTLVVGSGGTGTSTAFTIGSVVFAGASGTYTQDNANFFWDDTNNYLGIGTATPSTPLNVVANTSVDAVRITQTGAGNALVVEDSANPDSTPFVIDAAGQVIQGNATNVAVANPVSGAALSPSFEIVGTSALTTPSFVRQDTSASPQAMVFAKSRGSVSSPTVVASADVIGRISFQGYDGANFIRAATIDATVDGTPGTTDMPGRLTFSTTADGASTPTEAMRITSAGSVGIGSTNPAYKLSLAGANVGLNVVETGSTYSMAFRGNSAAPNIYDLKEINANRVALSFDTSGQIISLFTAGSERMRLDATGNLGIGTTAPASKLDVRAANITDTTDTGQITIFTTTAQAANVGGKLALGGLYDGSNYLTFGSIAGRKENSTSGNWSGYLQFSTRVFGANLEERMRIDSAGNVGIGTTTTNPAGFGKGVNLDGTSNVGYQVSVGGTFTGYFGAYTSETRIGSISTYPMTFYTNSSERMRIHSSGGVSIGNTTDPGLADLSVTGQISIGTSAAPTALLTLAAGTATANTAPIKFTSGTNLTTPEAGTVEYDGTIITASSNTNFKRGTVPLTNYTSGTGTALGTNTEATLAALLPAANDTITLSIGTYFIDTSFIVTRGASTTSATARLNILGTGTAAGNFSGMSLSAPTAGGATANFSFDGVNINVSNVLTAASTTSAGVYQISLQGILKVTTSGTIIPQYNLSANINGAGTVAKVLYLRLQQLDTQSATASGPAGTGWA